MAVLDKEIVEAGVIFITMFAKDPVVVIHLQTGGEHSSHDATYHDNQPGL